MRFCMKKIFLLIISMILIGCNESTADNKTIKIVAAQNQTNITSPYQIGMNKLKEIAEKNKQFEVEVHAGTIGTNENELVEKLVLGGADIVLVSPGFITSAGINEVDLFSLLYLFNDYNHWEKVF